MKNLILANMEDGNNLTETVNWALKVIDLQFTRGWKNHRSNSVKRQERYEQTLYTEAKPRFANTCEFLKKTK